MADDEIPIEFSGPNGQVPEIFTPDYGACIKRFQKALQIAADSRALIRKRKAHEAQQEQEQEQ